MSETQLREQRAAQNQSLFREINARLVDLNEVFEPLVDRSTFVCECAAIECVQEIDLTLEEYQLVRENPRRFIVAPSVEHVIPDVELVVERHDTYYVVEKVGVGAEIAEARIQAAADPNA